MTVHAPKIGLPIAPPALRVWIPTLLWIAALCAVFGLVFQYEIRGAVRVWNDSAAYNHCYLVLPLAGALLWMRRDVLATLRPEPSWWPLLLLPAASALWLASALLDIAEGAQLSAILLFEILLLAVLGWQVFRALMAPLLFLFFLVPFGEFLVPALQTFTAAFTVHGLQLLGIPVFADGYIIQIPAGKFEVAEACAGLRFLIASIVFGCFFATIVYRSIWRRAIFIALSIDPADRGERVSCPGSCSARPFNGERRLGDGRPRPLWLAFFHDRDTGADRDRDQFQGQGR